MAEDEADLTKEFWVCPMEIRKMRRAATLEYLAAADEAERVGKTRSQEKKEGEH